MGSGPRLRCAHPQTVRLRAHPPNWIQTNLAPRGETKPVGLIESFGLRPGVWGGVPAAAAPLPPLLAGYGPESFPGRKIKYRTGYQIYKRARRILDPSNYGGRWTEEEDRQLTYWHSMLGKVTIDV